MTWNPRPTIKALQTVLAKSGAFSKVLIGEPFSPPSDRAAAIMITDLDPSQATLNSTIDVWVVMIRIYCRAGMTEADAETTELTLAEAVSNLETALAGGFTLGGTVRAIDWVGEEQGHKVTFKWGHLVVGQTIFKVVDATVPLIIDDSGQFAA